MYQVGNFVEMKNHVVMMSRYDFERKMSKIID